MGDFKKNQSMSHVHDAKWAVSLTNRPDANNPISFPQGGIIHQSARKALPWGPGHGANGVADSSRFEIASVYIERLFKYAKVKDPKKLAAAQDWKPDSRLSGQSVAADRIGASLYSTCGSAFDLQAQTRL